MTQKIWTLEKVWDSGHDALEEIQRLGAEHEILLEALRWIARGYCETRVWTEWYHSLPLDRQRTLNDKMIAEAALARVPSCGICGEQHTS